MKQFFKRILKSMPFFDDMFNILDNKILVNPIEYTRFKLFNYNPKVYWPVHKTSKIIGNVKIGKNCSVGANPGCYIQGIGEIIIGDYTIIAQNTGIISANHDVYDYRKHIKEKTIIGSYCWIGMNSVILPGVKLGNHTIVGAGSIVTKSFEEGYCIIAGNPAKIIKKLDKNKCIDYRDKNEYYGYIQAEKFATYKNKYLI